MYEDLSTRITEAFDHLRGQFPWLDGFFIPVFYRYSIQEPVVLRPIDSESAPSSDLKDTQREYTLQLKQFSFAELIAESNVDSTKKKDTIFRFFDPEKTVTIQGGGALLEIPVVQDPEEFTENTINQLETIGLSIFRHSPLKEHSRYIQETLNVTVLDGWGTTRKEVWFIPIQIPGRTSVIALISLNLSKPLSKEILREIIDNITKSIIPYLGWHFSGAHVEDLQKRIAARTENAVRTAVFARNFSHIIGSHVVSNHRFRHSLAGINLMQYFKIRLKQSQLRFVESENRLLKLHLEYIDSLYTAAMTLEDIQDKLGTGDILLESTRRFHEYLQGRFDFIARAIDDSKASPEPVWFVKDLLEGFLNQTAYLDNLVADIGLRRECLEFCLMIEKDTYLAEWTPIAKPEDIDQVLPETIWRNSTQPGIRQRPEKLVSFPGGMASAHAFYSLLENIIRNSAKYGSHKDKKTYKVTIQICQIRETAQEQRYLKVSIWDNYSLAFPNYYTTIQKKLEEEFISADGKAKTDNLGMMEMQSCAKFLCHANEKGIYPVKRPSHVTSEKINLWTSGLDESREIDAEHPPLVFNLSLNQTLLMACLTSRPVDEKFELTCWLDDLKEVEDLSPFLLVIDGNLCEMGRLKPFLDNHTAYPQRIVTVCRDEQKCKQWKECFSTTDLPDRRIVCLYDENIYERIFSTILERDEKNSILELEKNSILASYEAWLRAWKPPPVDKIRKWDLWIGFERQGKQVQESWGNADEYFSDDSLVRLMVVSHYINDTSVFQTRSTEMVYKNGEDSYWNEESEAPLASKKALVFDNHGNCFPSVQKNLVSLSTATRFYQQLSGSASPELFRILSSPPQDEFGFRFFVYSLVEACLANILVVDERLAMNLLEGGSSDQPNENFTSDLLEHQNAGIYPVFRFRAQGQNDNLGFYSPSHRDRLVNIIRDKTHEDKPHDILDQEGIIFINSEYGEGAQCSIKSLTSTNDRTVLLCEIQQFDIIIMHEGAMDILVSDGVKWKGRENPKQLQEQLQGLYQLAPIIARTSGRGRNSKLLGDHLPFIEFTQVSSALLTARNKFSLVRALLGSVGKAIQVEES